MPRISSFYGILIAMYYREHGVPHFHARYGDDEASISIDSLAVIAGGLPPRALRMVRRWGEMHREQLRANWRRANREEVLESIEPLP